MVLMGFCQTPCQAEDCSTLETLISTPLLDRGMARQNESAVVLVAADVQLQVNQSDP